jgi:GTP-binding protein
MAASQGAGDDNAEAAAIEAGRLLFAQECEFIMGVPTEADLPTAELPEVAFAGRSNVGKSSLVNALTGRNTLARTSQTPGRTQQLNFFDLAETLCLVDLPGYGYAKASKTAIANWTNLVNTYLKGRANLVRVFILIDARHGTKDVDRTIMDMLDVAAVTYQAVLTKCDKLTAEDLDKRRAEVEAESRRHVAAYPGIVATSASTKFGIEGFRAEIAALAAPR